MRVGLSYFPFRGLSPVLIVAVACTIPTLNPRDVWGQAAKALVSPAANEVATKATAPVPTQVEVAKGDTLFRIAGKVRHPGATLNQTVLALYRANPDAFFTGNINQLIVGRVLKVPALETVMAVDAAQAGKQLKELIAQPVVPVPPPAPPVKESPPPAKPKPEPPAKPAARPPLLTPSQAVARFEDGARLERNGDLQSAMTAYLEAGEAGYGIAQKRLGDIYNTGNAVVQRDYEIALKWYQKARAQGVEIPKPITSPGVRY